MSEPWRYRNKAQFPIGQAAGKIVAGCFRQRTHEVIDVADCLMQHPLNNLVLQRVKQLAEWDFLQKYIGILRHVLNFGKVIHFLLFDVYAVVAYN